MAAAARYDPCEESISGVMGVNDGMLRESANVL
jgi:hypothetical protein